MVAGDRDLLLGAAIQLIKDVNRLAFLGNQSTCVKIEYMTKDFLEQLEVKSNSQE